MWGHLLPLCCQFASLARLAPATRCAIKWRMQGYREARPERFELPTFGSVDRRSIQLSYGRVRAILDVHHRVRRRGESPTLDSSG